jgi:transposase
MHVEAHDTLEELERAVRTERVGRVRDRTHGVLLARRGHTAVEIAGMLSVSRRAVQGWVRRYNEGGLARLPDAPRPGQPRKCPRELFDAVKQRILDGPRPEDGVCTLRGPDVQRILAAEFGVVQELSATYELMHALGLEPLRPRPRHVKNDPEAMEAWLASAPLLSSASAAGTRTSRSKCGSRTRPASDSRAP